MKTIIITPQLLETYSEAILHIGDFTIYNNDHLSGVQDYLQELQDNNELSPEQERLLNRLNLYFSQDQINSQEYDTIRNIKASLLILHYYQLIEEGHEKDSPAVTHTKEQLFHMGWDDPETIAFDEDGIPTTVQTSGSLDHSYEEYYQWVTQLYEAVDNSPSYFSIT